MSPHDDYDGRPLKDYPELPPCLHGVLDPELDRVSQWYEEMIKKDFKLPSRTSKPEVEIQHQEILIVGAGVAGLVAATFLRNAGYTITIVEGNTRVGGRCRTIRNFPKSEKDRDALQKMFDASKTSDPQRPFSHDKSYGEAGAMRIPSRHKLVLAVMDRLNKNSKGDKHHQIEREEFLASPSPISDSEDCHGERMVYVNHKHLTRSQYEGYHKPSCNPGPNGERDPMGYDRPDAEVESSAADLLTDALRRDPSIRLMFEIRSRLLDSKNNSAATENSPDLKKVLREVLREVWWAVIKRHDKRSLQEFLKLMGVSPAGIEMIGIIENLESRMSLSFLHSLKTRLTLSGQENFYRVDRGTDLIPKEMFRQLATTDPKGSWLDPTPAGGGSANDGNPCPKAVFNLRLSGIRRVKGPESDDPLKVEVDTVKFDANYPDQIIGTGSDAEKVEKLLKKKRFDKAIITIPFSSLRMVRVSSKIGTTGGTSKSSTQNDPFSLGKRRAIRQLHYDAATKVLLEFKKDDDHPLPFWEEEGVQGGFSVTDMPNRLIYYPTANLEGNPVLLASYSWANDARRWDSMRHEERFANALRTVAIVHSKTIPKDLAKEKVQADALLAKVKDQAVWKEQGESSGGGSDGDLPSKAPKFEAHVNETTSPGAATISWASNAFAFGEAAVFRPDQLLDLYQHIISPEWSRNPDDKKKPKLDEHLVYFAGDHASMKSAWIEGAIESGIRAALEVHGINPYHRPDP